MSSLGDWTTRTDHPNDPRNHKEFDWLTEMNVSIDSAVYDHYSLPVILIDNEEYAVAKDEEVAISAATDYIRESVWAFNADFVLRHTSITRNDAVIKALSQMQQELCEDANELFYELVKENWDEFVNDAIESDGIGHFLSPYEGEEQQISDLWFEHINGTFDDDEWSDEVVRESFVEEIAKALNIDPTTSNSWLFYRVN